MLALTMLALTMVWPAPGAALEREGQIAVPSWERLTEREQELWVTQGVHAPASHLNTQAQRRAQGLVTQLKVAVLLVDFPDLPADRVTHTPEYFENLLFSRGVRPTPSVAEYLSLSSGGRLELTGEIRGWFTVSQERNTYTNGAGGLSYYPVNSQRLVEEVIGLADDTINFAHFDSEGPDGIADSGDDDEILDAIFVIHAGPGRESGGTTPDDFVSVYWWTPVPIPTDGVFGRFFILNSEEGTIGIFLHELGHLLGLPDLYDTDGGSFGLGQWSLMAGGFLLDQGTQPSDFDAWSKSKLGFVDTITLLQNQKDFVIPPVADSHEIYRLWRGGGGTTQYFLIENRRRIGLDAALPSEGLFIYHVDETLPSNRTPNHYKVALEQADGLFQLENRFNDSSIGDDGDPYHAGDTFGRYTIPNSVDYRGEGSEVSVFNIRGPGPAGEMTADLSVEPGPLVDLVDLNLVELVGDGDGLLSAGELIGVSPGIAVSRFPATGVLIRAMSSDPSGTLLDSERVLGLIAAEDVVAPTQPFRIQIAAEVPTDPYGLDLQFEVQWDDAPPRIISVELGIGTVVGREDDFDIPSPGWTHASVRPTAIDQWQYGPSYGVNGTPGFKNGYFNGGFVSGADAVLTSPPILIPANATLLFDQIVDIVNNDPEKPRAGGVVEISVNGGDWQTAFPRGGYPAFYRGSHLEWIGRPIFTETVNDGLFYTVGIDLSSFAGSVRVRFRFFSETSTRVGKGWHIDNVRIVTDVTPVRVVSAEAAIMGEDVHLNWTLASPTPIRVRWVRGTVLAAAQVVGTGWLPGSETGTLIDKGAARHLPTNYWLEGLERDGSIDRWGPWAVTGEPQAMVWRMQQNPSHGVSRFSWPSALPAGAILEIFDVRGSLVFSSPLDLAPGTFAWDGERHTGGRVSPGVYFARIKNSEWKPIRLVRLP